MLVAADSRGRVRQPQGPLLPTPFFVQSHAIVLSQRVQLVRYNSLNASHFAVSNGYLLTSLIFTWLLINR